MSGLTGLKRKVMEKLKGWQPKKECYIRCRRNCAVERHTVLYESFYGRGMLDNPNAFFCEMLRNPAYKDYRHIWVLDDPENHRQLMEKYKTYPNVSFVKFQSCAYAKALATVEILINNCTFYSFFIKRPEQIYINTWHGIPLKCLGYDKPDGNMEVANAVRNFLQADYLLAANAFMADMYRQTYRMDGLFRGKILLEGYPRMDLLVNTQPEQAYEMLAQNGVKVDPRKRILLYAPTWRGEEYDKPDISMEAYTTFKERMEAQIDTDRYQILVKAHQVVYHAIQKQAGQADWMVPATVDANVLLSVTDILVSDYSSIYFDFLETGRPVLFYIPDVQEYVSQRGLYFSLSDLPGPYTDSLDVLGGWIRNIEEIFRSNEGQYQKVRAWCGGYSMGDVSRRILEGILQEAAREPEAARGTAREQEDIRETAHEQAAGEQAPQAPGRTGVARPMLHTVPVQADKKTMLFFLDHPKTDGITSSMLGLFDRLDYTCYDVTLCCGYHKTEEEKALLRKLNPAVRLLFRDYIGDFCLQDLGKLRYLNQNGLKTEAAKKKMPWYFFREEAARLLGTCRFDYVFDYCGYSLSYALLVQAVDGEKKGIWMHNDMQAEFSLKYPMLDRLFSVYPYFDRLISCSEEVMRVNREKLGTKETQEHFVYCTNVVDHKRILAQMKTCRPPEDKTVRFLNIGRMSPEKNQAALIRAFAKFHEDCPDSMLYILGDGKLRSELEKTAEESGIKDCVIFTGNVPDPGKYMALCDCFVLPSLYEGQPVVLHEARTAKMPVLMSRFSSYKSASFPGGQYFIGTEEGEIQEGLRAFVQGKVPADYTYDPEEHNQTSVREFLTAIGEI